MRFEVASMNYWPDPGSKEPMRLAPPTKEPGWRLRDTQTIICREERTSVASRTEEVQRTYQIIAIWERAIHEENE